MNKTWKIKSIRGVIMRDKRFTFLCTLDDRKLLADISGRLHRRQSDVVRLLIREAAIQQINRDSEINNDKANSSPEMNLLG